MTACSKWEAALLEAALGQPAEADLQEHLAACSNCSAALARWRKNAAQVDLAIQQLVAAPPRPQGPERVLARIGAQAVVSSPWRVALATGIVVAGLLLALFLPRTQRQSPSAVGIAISDWQSPTESLLDSFTDPVWKGIPPLGYGFLEEKPAGEKNVP